MRITSQSNVDVSLQQSVAKAALISKTVEPVKTTVQASTEKTIESVEKNTTATRSRGEREIPKEKLQQAVETMNGFLDTSKKASKFVLHDGLDKYYVRLVDSETEEVIKEIPPERLLDAFYEMQKLAGMIVDEKI